MPLTYRPATLDDSYTVFQIFRQSITDLGQRQGVTTITGGQDPAVLAKLWETRRPLFEHLAQTAEHFWLAENDGRPVGYARSILRDGVRELTEYFVLPGEQSAGVGRELLARAFPRDGARHRTIIATTDMRAQARYLKAGVYPRFPICYFGRKPEAVKVESDLVMESISESPETLTALQAVDLAIFGHRRDIDHAWLLANRSGSVFRRNGQMVGYGYIGAISGGPIALLNEADFPAALGLVESQAAHRGDGVIEEFGFETPLINRAAVNYLLGRGYRIDSFMALFMCDEPFAKFENYICTSPPFFF